MRDSLFLAWQYLRHHRLTTTVLVASLTLIIFLPAGLQLIVQKAERHFRSRADTTPLLIGPKGSSLELVLGCLYFDKTYEEVMPFEEYSRVADQELGIAIPIHTRFEASDSRIVGTTSDYFGLRDLRFAQGNSWTIPGGCVLGAKVAARHKFQIGDKIAAHTSSAFVLDNPPLRLNVTGILNPTESPDDEIILISLGTAWIMEGLGHGHARDAEHGSPEASLYTEITEENAASFHFHGDRETFPISSVIVVPESSKAETILRGQYFSPKEIVQIVRPSDVMDSLLEKIFMVRSYLIAIIGLITLVTLLTMAMVVILSIRMRKAEIITMSKIGCSRLRMGTILGSQIAMITVVSLIIASVLALITHAYGAQLIRLIIL